MKKEIRQYFSKIGKKGGKIGGVNRMNLLTHEERTTLAMLGVAARKKNRIKKAQP